MRPPAQHKIRSISVIRGLLTFSLMLPSGASLPQPNEPPACREWRECRQLALDAAARGDAEAFHDLAWRAVQTGPPRDPDLMYLLARAQSLSGRPGDALVMLRRLAERGVATDAATNEDFGRVRALPAWPEVERLIAAAASPPVPTAPAPPPPVSTAAAPPPLAPAGEEALRTDALRFKPAGLAYDAVSRRFVVGDRSGRRLVVIDEASRRVTSFVGAASAGFRDVTALEIDPWRGDLWVVTAGGLEDADAGESTLHKLQLVSGRPLETWTAPHDAGPVRFVDVAVTRNGTVFALDAAGARIFRLRPGSRALEPVLALGLENAVSVSAARETILYVAHSAGIARGDLAGPRVARVATSGGIDLSGIERLRWRDGSLVAVQTRGGGSRIVRLDMDAGGRRIIREGVLDAATSTSGSLATLAGDVFFYLAAAPFDGARVGEAVIRRVRLR